MDGNKFSLFSSSFIFTASDILLLLERLFVFIFLALFYM